MKLLPQDFDGSVFPSINDYVRAKIKGYAFEHRTATTEEHDKAVLDMIRAVYHDDLSVAGPPRHQIWEQGWAENLAKFDRAKAGLEIAKPHYHSKYPIVRWKGDLYVPLSEGYEYNMLALIEDWVFDRWLREFKWIAEFGCGTGHNLFRMREVCPEARLVGLDWAGSAVQFINLQAHAGAYGDPSMVHAEHFDYFNPNPSMYVPPNGAAFVTVASLEQTGREWRKWMEWALDAKPQMCIHIEPIEEVLEPDVLLDHLSLEYFTKRGYLTGFLRNLGQSYKHRVEILEVVRPRIGSKFIEGYTVVVWRPKP
ncbi:MAG: hypothetical protein ACOYB3_00195 [Azonexus sp.]